MGGFFIAAIIMYTETIGCSTGLSPGPGIRGGGLLLLVTSSPSEVAFATAVRSCVALNFCISTDYGILITEFWIMDKSIQWSRGSSCVVVWRRMRMWQVVTFSEKEEGLVRYVGKEKGHGLNRRHMITRDV